MVELKIPDALGKWIVAYRTISDLEYEFYLRELSIDTIHIKAEELKETKKYYGEVRFNVNGLITASLAVPASASSNSRRAIIKSLREFLTYRIKHEAKIFNSNQRKRFRGERMKNYCSIY
jgi:hypothetical protein